MCTDIQLKAHDKSVVVGRTMDFEIETQAALAIVKKGTKQNTTTPDGEKSLSWTTQYSYLGITAFNSPKYFIHSINEQGLIMAILWLPETQFPILKCSQYSNSIHITDLTGFILGSSTTITQVKQKLKKVHIWADKMPQLGNIIPPIHLVFHDKSGNSIVVEFIEGKMNIHKNIGIVTNSPSYDWHLTNLRNYMRLTNQDVESLDIEGKCLVAPGKGNGLFGMPGDFTPPSRFIRGYMLAQFVNKPQTVLDAIVSMSHILGNVTVPKGTSIHTENKEEMQNYTQWLCISDLHNMQFYIKNANSLGYIVIDLNKIWNISNSKLVKLAQIYSEAGLNITKLFE